MAARMLLGISREELAKAAKISTRTLASFEMGLPGSKITTLEAIQSALTSKYGIQLLPEDQNNGYGVRFPVGHFESAENKKRAPRKTKAKSKTKTKLKPKPPSE